MVVLPVGLVQLHTYWWVVAHVIVAGCAERRMLVGLGQPVARHMVWCQPGTTGMSWVHTLWSHHVPSTPELHWAHPNCCCNGLTSPLACCIQCQWFSFSCNSGWRMLCPLQGCHSSMHLQSIGHRFCCTLWWHCAAPALGNLHPVEPRWPFHLRHCQWRAGTHSGSASDMLYWPTWLACSCMPSSISVSWQSKCPSIFTDLFNGFNVTVMAVAPAILILSQLASFWNS